MKAIFIALVIVLILSVAPLPAAAGLYLDAVTNGLSVRELAQLADVAAEVRQRWGLEA